MTASALEAADLSHRFAGDPAAAPALDGVSLRLAAGESLCVVGPSGSGKSTLLACVLGLLRPQAGDVCLDGVSLGAMDPAQRRAFRRSVQPVFQDPASSLAPRMRVRQALAEPLIIQSIGDRGDRGDRRQRIERALGAVHLGTELLERFPHQLSGGQQQRVAIARALIVEPRFLVADEPTSALDTVVAMHIGRLLAELVERLGLGLIVVTHDGLLPTHLRAPVARMHAGKLVEHLDADAWLARTRALWSPMNDADESREADRPSGRAIANQDATSERG